MRLLNKMLGISLPSIPVNNVAEEEHKEVEVEKNILAYVNFFLLKDGTINILTDWREENSQLAQVYAQLLYQINTGALEDGIFNVLMKYGLENIKSQNFIAEIVTSFRQLQQRYKNLPLISPSQALKVAKE